MAISNSTIHIISSNAFPGLTVPVQEDQNVISAHSEFISDLNKFVPNYTVLLALHFLTFDVVFTFPDLILTNFCGEKIAMFVLIVSGLLVIVVGAATLTLFTRQPVVNWPFSFASKLKTAPSFSSDVNKPSPSNDDQIPIVSVNYHFTRLCNYSCGFCFHTKKTTYLAPIEDAKRGLRKLADLGMKKLNLSGGEPFLHERFVGEICRYAKEELRLESMSIVSNGSKIREAFFVKYGEFVDILAISVDSFNEETNVKIGRGDY